MDKVVNRLKCGTRSSLTDYCFSEKFSPAASDHKQRHSLRYDRAISVCGVHVLVSIAEFIIANRR